MEDKPPGLELTYSFETLYKSDHEILVVSMDDHTPIFLECVMKTQKKRKEVRTEAEAATVSVTSGTTGDAREKGNTMPSPLVTRQSTRTSPKRTKNRQPEGGTPWGRLPVRCATYQGGGGWASWEFTPSVIKVGG